MYLINYNGAILPAENPAFKISNRALRYGDGLFETILYSRKKIWFLKDHINRLLNGMKVLRMKAPFFFTEKGISEKILELINQADVAEKTLRIRLQIFRSDGGLYSPANNEIEYFMEYEILSHKNQIKNELIKNVGVFRGFFLYPTSISRFKTCNSLPYILASVFRKENNYSDVLLFDNKENLAECISSNIFWYKRGKLFTPSLETGCIEGVMRAHVIKAAMKLGLKIREIKMPMHVLTSAQCVFCTNVIRGIRIISEILSWRLTADEEIVNALRRKIMEDEH